MPYPKNKELIDIFIASFKSHSDFKLLSKDIIVHFLFEEVEYYVYLKCISYAGRPYPDNVTRAQLPQHTAFESIKDSPARFLFLGYDLDNKLFVCWDPVKSKSRLNRRSYVSFFSRKSIQESVLPGEIKTAHLTNGDRFVLFKAEDTIVFFSTIDNYFSFVESSQSSIQTINAEEEQEEISTISGMLEKIEEGSSVMLLVNELQDAQSDRMTIIASCMNTFGSFYPNMGFNNWKNLIYNYLDKFQEVKLIDDISLVEDQASEYKKLVEDKSDDRKVFVVLPNGKKISSQTSVQLLSLMINSVGVGIVKKLAIMVDGERLIQDKPHGGGDYSLELSPQTYMYSNLSSYQVSDILKKICSVIKLDCKILIQ